jgi:hypothetical protein
LFLQECTKLFVDSQHDLNYQRYLVLFRV